MWNWLKTNKELFFIIASAIFLIALFQIKQQNEGKTKSNEKMSQAFSINYTECPKPCLNCIGLSASNCTTCKEGLTLVERGQIQNIPFGECICPYRNQYLTDGFECKMCDSNCNICDKDGNCVECKKGWYIAIENNVKKCKQCHKTCTSCVIDSDICLSCINGYYNFNDSFCCPINCFQCSKINNCTKCHSEFYLQESTEEANSFMCQHCHEQCKTCFGSRISECNSCHEEMLLFPEKHLCVKSCDSGYYIDNKECKKCQESCQECAGPRDDQCTMCVNENQTFCCDKSCQKCTGPDLSQCLKPEIKNTTLPPVNISSEYKQLHKTQFKFEKDADYMMGMTFVSDRYCPNVTFGSEKALLSLKQIHSTGAKWVAIVVTEYQYASSSVTIYPIYKPIQMNYYTHISSTIPNLTFIIKAAHRLGMRVMLKPHIDLQSNGERSAPWRGNIGGFNQTEVKQWFSSYTGMILKYAALAQALDVELFSISCELVTVNSYEANWRAVYNGNLTASANPGEEYAKAYWDDLDYIGVDAYYLNPSDGQNWTTIYSQLDTIFKQLKTLSNKYNKSLLITETGHCSSQECGRTSQSTETALQTQAAFYQAFLEIAKNNKEWIKGIFFWAWNSDPAFGGNTDQCISPQYKPAEEIMREYYGGTERIPKPDYPAECMCTV